MKRDEQPGAGDAHFLSTCLTQGLQSGHLTQCSEGPRPVGRVLHSTMRQEHLGFKPRSAYFTAPTLGKGGRHGGSAGFMLGSVPALSFPYFVMHLFPLKTLLAVAFNELNFYMCCGS